jgi:carboxylate-amine ligase
MFDSARLNSVFAFPLSGRAPFELHWDDFLERYLAKMVHTGIVVSMKDFYWDIRPKPEYGTIELRVCDAPLQVERAAALAGYLQTLCAWLLDGNESPPCEEDYLVYTFNRFQACRFGLDGTVVNPKTHEQLPLRVHVLDTLRRIARYAADLSAEEALAHIARLVYEGNDVALLRGEFELRGNLAGVVDLAMQRFRQ